MPHQLLAQLPIHVITSPMWSVSFTMLAKHTDCKGHMTHMWWQMLVELTNALQKQQHKTAWWLWDRQSSNVKCKQESSPHAKIVSQQLPLLIIPHHNGSFMNVTTSLSTILNSNCRQLTLPLAESNDILSSLPLSSSLSSSESSSSSSSPFCCSSSSAIGSLPRDKWSRELTIFRIMKTMAITKV